MVHQSESRLLKERETIMATIYEVGSISIVKDMVFGWCIRNSQGAWLIVDQLELQSLKELSAAFWPNYVPEEFKESVKKAVVEAQIKQATYTNNITAAQERAKAELAGDEARTKQLAEELNRSKDRHLLISQLMSNSSITGDGSVLQFELGYVTLLKLHSTNWTVVGKNNNFVKSFKDFDSAIDQILRRWW